MAWGKPDKLSGLTWGELCDLVDQNRNVYDPDLVVVTTVTYGDYSNTAQALPLTEGELCIQEIEESGYSHSNFALVPEVYSSDLVKENDDGDGPEFCESCKVRVGLPHKEDCPALPSEDQRPQQVLVLT